MAKFCSNCGKALNEGISFCPECGTRVADVQTEPVFTPEPEYTAETELSRNPEPESAFESAPEPTAEFFSSSSSSSFTSAAPAPAPEPVPVPVPAPTPAVQPQPTPQPAYRQPEQVYTDPYSYPPQPQAQSQEQAAYPAAPVKEKKAVSTIGFMLLQLLYAIPIVGFFAALVLSIAPEKKDMKHHALANLLWKLIFLALLIFGAFRAKTVVENHWSEWSQSISELTGGQADLGSILNGLQYGNFIELTE